ncbi:hypothetical protein FZEAL_949 [Fusarium zealandicum]|uniref:Apple domain-containing protein n=1 Tax=Fusarium zealandicum TaxID=1053134 RepID=A0A8H4XP95_9HYPO|nr:hypothetical protein FZEAL_949 [Fusarium zealandicum]
MPSAKTIAVAVTALAASGVHAGPCKPTSSGTASTDLFSPTATDTGSADTTAILSTSTTENASTTDTSQSSQTATEVISTSATEDTTTSTTEATTTSQADATSTTSSTTSTCTDYILTFNEDADGPPCGIDGYGATSFITPGDSSSREECAESCLVDSTCQMFAYYEVMVGITSDYSCLRYSDTIFTPQRNADMVYYQRGCFECNRGSDRGGRGGRGRGRIRRYQ